MHWLKSADAALALSADEGLPHSQCQWPHRLLAMVRGATTAQANTLESTFGVPIKQYPGQIQVTRAVKVKAPGKHFTAPHDLGDHRALQCQVPPDEDTERNTSGGGSIHLNMNHCEGALAVGVTPGRVHTSTGRSTSLSSGDISD